MSVVFSGMFEPVRLSWRWDGSAGGRRVAFDDAIAARAELRSLAAEAGFMTRLRRLLHERGATPGHGVDDGEVLDRLARWIAAGDLEVWGLGAQGLTTWGDTDEEAPVSAVTVASEAEPEPVVIEQTFGDDIDPAAIAAAMKEAARLGVPFCEECTKKKLRAERAAAAGASA